MDGSSELLPCVGKLEIAKPKPVAFLCGSLPVLADDPFSRSALLPSPQTVEAPRYQMLPRETDLNSLPLLPHDTKKVFSAACSSGEDPYFKSCPVSENLSRKCEALAVSGLAHYGDEIDVVAPADILKQIFKIPYSKSRLSVAVHRIGDTLILNTGPDVEEGEKIFRRQTNQSRGADSSVFLNFAMHSVRAEACDCPPGHYATPDCLSNSNALPGHYQHTDGSPISPPIGHSRTSQVPNDKENDSFHGCAAYSQKKDNVFRDKKKNVRRPDPVPKRSQVGDKARGPVQESEKSRRVGNNGFLRVLFWQFHNFRMLLGSDLLLFSNEKYVAVSLHLWDVARQVTPLTWLEAWLDNVMASVPELAICYHQNGVIQGYELLKTDDIFLLKGISDDGTPAFHPQVVHQNGLSVLRFLQDNCKQDPGSYWLYKNAGEDVIQLFDLSVLPKSSSTDHDRGCSSLPSLMNKGRRDSLFSLGTLLYRVAHRLSLSESPDDKAKCAKFFKKCLDFVGEQDQLVVRAYAHEQYARLILRCDRELDMVSEAYLLGPEVTVMDMEEDSSVFSLGMFGSPERDKVPQTMVEDTPLEDGRIMLQCPLTEEKSSNMKANNDVPKNIPIDPMEISSFEDIIMPASTAEDKFSLDHKDELTASNDLKAVSEVHTITDPNSSKLAAIHHVSQAIKSLRWNRQLQKIQEEIPENGGVRNQDRFLPSSFSVCSCGDADCIEVCDIREWLSKSKMDNKLWKLVLLLGETYLALGEAYKEDGQLLQALKVVEIACSVYGSMPQHLEGAQFISSLVNYSSAPHKRDDGNIESGFPIDEEVIDADSAESADNLHIKQIATSRIFWAKAWTLVGDVFVEYYRARSQYILKQDGVGNLPSGLKMSNEVVREVIRLKKKLGRYKHNCSTCSLMNCSCQSDRASSGNSASSSARSCGGNMHSLPYSRKHGRKTNTKSSSRSHFETLEGDQVSSKVNNNEGIGNEKVHCKKTIMQELPSHTNDQIVSSSLHTEEAVNSADQLVEPAESPGTSMGKQGGIFEFLGGPKHREVGYNLFVAIRCYDEARKAISGCHVDTDELQVSLIKKKGWVSNELGRYRLEKKDLTKAELAFKSAIKSFREVSDHTNIILINCNMGHGRRALAEERVSKMEMFGSSVSHDAFKQSMNKAKMEYIKSIRYYEDAKKELNAVGETLELHLHNEVYTQFAHTYLRLGMLLAKDDMPEVSRNENHEQLSVGQLHLCSERIKGSANIELSAGDAFRESLSAYESLGELRKQEAAFAHFQLGCYHRSSCLKLLDLKQVELSISENNHQKAKWYASLAEKHWQKAIEFYGAKSHPTMFITIILELSTLHMSLSSLLHSNIMLDSSLSHCLEVRHTVGEASKEDSNQNLVGDIQEKFWHHLQGLLKKMLMSAPGSSSKQVTTTQVVTSHRADYSEKLKEMYRMSLKSPTLQALHAMHKLWTF